MSTLASIFCGCYWRQFWASIQPYLLFIRRWIRNRVSSPNTSVRWSVHKQHPCVQSCFHNSAAQIAGTPHFRKFCGLAIFLWQLYAAYTLSAISFKLSKISFLEASSTGRTRPGCKLYCINRNQLFICMETCGKAIQQPSTAVNVQYECTIRKRATVQGDRGGP